MRLTLDNAKRRNALSGKMMVELSDAVDELHRQSEKGGVTHVVIQGAQGTFCSGSDLSVVKSQSGGQDDETSITAQKQLSDLGASFSVFMHDTLLRLATLPVISVAAIQGSAVGGGTEIALCCDQRVFDPAASFYMLHKKMGVVPGWGGGVRLVGILGRSQALRLLANPRKLTPHECKDIGIADASHPKEATLNRLYMRTSARMAKTLTLCVP